MVHMELTPPHESRLLTPGPGLARESLLGTLGDHSAKKFCSPLVWLKRWKEGPVLPAATFLLPCQKSPITGKQNAVMMTFQSLGTWMRWRSPHTTSRMRGKHGRKIKRKREREGKGRRTLPLRCEA